MYRDFHFPFIFLQIPLSENSTYSPFHFVAAISSYRLDALAAVNCLIRLILEYNSCMANSLRMFLLLIRVRLNGALNQTKKTWISSPLFAIGLVSLGVSLFVAIYVGFNLFFQLAAQLQVLSEIGRAHV